MIFCRCLDVKDDRTEACTVLNLFHKYPGISVLLFVFG